MTTPRTPDAESGFETASAWFQANAKNLYVGLGLIAVAAVSIWFYMRSGQIKRLNADRALNQARQALAAGNTALAATDLGRVATRYVGTLGGAHAAMLLAQLEYDRAQHPVGLSVLDNYRTASAAGAALADVWSLIGDGKLSVGQLDSAAAAYRRAADLTKLPGTKAMYRAKLARVLMASGKDAEARALWEQLASDPDAAAQKNEAEVRLGELTARPAGGT